MDQYHCYSPHTAWTHDLSNMLSEFECDNSSFVESNSNTCEVFLLQSKGTLINHFHGLDRGYCTHVLFTIE